MEPSRGAPRGSHPFERVREHLLVSLHLGRLQPGDRVPSVRRFAVMSGMNRKTVHRAYRALVGEGFLAVRPGAGTFVATSPGPHPSAQREDELVHVVNRCRAEAHSLGVTATAFADFVQNALNGGLGNFFGDGTICAGGSVRRLGVRMANGAGSANWSTGLLSALGYAPGEDAVFQVWYRDDAHGACNAGFNLSNGYQLQLAPWRAEFPAPAGH